MSKLESEKGDIKKLEETICKFQDQLDAERKQAALMHEKVMALEADKDKFEEILVEAQALIRDKETPESSKMIDLFVAYNVENMTDLERQSQDVKSLNIVIANARKDAHAKTETQIRSLKKKLTVCQNEKDALLKATKLLASKVQELHHSTTVVEPVGVEVRENAYQRVLSPHTLEKMEHTFSQERRPACEFGRSIERVYQRDLLLELHYHDKDEKEQFYNVSAKYTGPLLEGVPHGPGILRFVCGDMYLGEFEMGEMMGFGAFNHVRRDDHINQVFKGEFSHNEFRGANKKKAPLIERVLVSRTPSKLIALGDANCSTSRSNNGVAIFLFQENDNQQQL